MWNAEGGSTPASHVISPRGIPGIVRLHGIASPGWVCIIKIKALDFDLWRPGCSCHLAGELGLPEL